MKKLKHFYKLFLLFCISLHGGLISATPAATLEELEAVFLYNFSSFMTWPEERLGDDSPFNICVLGGHEALLVALHTTVDSEVNTEDGHPLEIVEFESALAKKLLDKDQQVLEQASSCHILFIHDDIQDLVDMKDLLNVLSNHAVLTVSDMEDFTEYCGMVQFEVSIGDRINLHMQYPRLEQAKVGVASALLELVDLSKDSHCGAP